MTDSQKAAKQLSDGGKPFRLLRLDESKGYKPETLGFSKVAAAALNGIRIPLTQDELKSGVFTAGEISESFNRFAQAAVRGNVAVQTVQVSVAHEFLENGALRTMSVTAPVHILSSRENLGLGEDVAKSLAKGDGGVAHIGKGGLREAILSAHLPPRKSGKNKFQKISALHVMGKDIFLCLSEGFLHAVQARFGLWKEEPSAAHGAAAPQKVIHLLGMKLGQNGGVSAEQMGFLGGRARTLSGIRFYPDSGGKNSRRIKNETLEESFDRFFARRREIVAEQCDIPVSYAYGKTPNGPEVLQGTARLYLLSCRETLPLVRQVAEDMAAGKTETAWKGTKIPLLAGENFLTGFFASQIQGLRPGKKKPEQLDAWYNPEHEYFIVLDRSGEAEMLFRLKNIFGLQCQSVSRTLPTCFPSLK